MKRTKFFVAVFALIMGGSIANAQVTGGVKAGVNYSNMSGIHDNADYKINPTGGVSFEYSNSVHFKSTIELLYSPKGTKYEYQNLQDSVKNITEDFKYDYSFDYLEIPIMVNYYLGNDSSKFRPKFFLGPDFGIRLFANQELDYKKASPDSVISEFVREDANFQFKYSPVDIGAVAGAGFSYQLSSKLFLSFEVRYSMSLTDLSENVSNEKSIRNRNISSLAGISYKLQ